MGMESRTWHMLGKHSTTEIYFQPLVYILRELFWYYICSVFRFITMCPHVFSFELAALCVHICTDIYTIYNLYAVQGEDPKEV